MLLPSLLVDEDVSLQERNVIRINPKLWYSNNCFSFDNRTAKLFTNKPIRRRSFLITDDKPSQLSLNFTFRANHHFSSYPTHHSPGPSRRAKIKLYSLFITARATIKVKFYAFWVIKHAKSDISPWILVR